MSEDIELLREIRDLLAVMAEPAIAQRDAKRRAALSTLVGKSKQKWSCTLGLHTDILPQLEPRFGHCF